MPKQNCKKCGEPTYFTECDSEGYCFDCSTEEIDKELDLTDNQ